MIEVVPTSELLISIITKESYLFVIAGYDK